MAISVQNRTSLKESLLQSFFVWKDDHHTLPLTPPRGEGAENAKWRSPSKIALRLKKVCYKVSLCEKCQRQSYKAFICLTICAKMTDEATLLLEILGQSDRVGAKSPIFFKNLFSPNSVAFFALCKSGRRNTNTFCSRNVGQKSSF